MKILIVGSFRWNIYSPAFYHGFTELGAEVRSVDTFAYQYHGCGSEILNKIHGHFHIGPNVYRLNKNIIREVKIFNPDLVFFYYCLDVYESTYKKIKQLGTKFFTYCNDDPYGKFLMRPWNKKFHKSLYLADWNFVYRYKNVIDYNGDGINNVSVLLPYYIRKNNFPMNCERTIPIAFMGHWENDGRDSYINSLIGEKIDIKVYGDDATWQHSIYYNKFKQLGVLTPRKGGSEYNYTINQQQVALVFLSKKNNDTYTRRCFEIPITKTCMLCEYTDDMNRMFPEGECAEYFRNKTELIEKAKYLTEHPEECLRIGNNAYNRILELRGSEVDRCNEIIEKFVVLQSQEKTIDIIDKN